MWDCVCLQQAFEFFPDLCECVDFPQCGTPDAGECCTANPSGLPGCNHSDCCYGVCLIDPFCCNVAWDSLCANEAVGLCQNCDGPCGFANESCCNDAWSQACVDLAMELCDVCMPPDPGDLDQDGDVDVNDYAIFESCLTGPEGGLLAGCVPADLHADSDVDLQDFAVLSLNFTGSP